MITPTRARPPYYVASVPIVLALGQVLFAAAPLSTLWAGMALAAVFAVLLWAGGIWFRRSQPGFGRAAPFRLWQAPVFWVPVVIGLVGLLCYRFTA